MPFLNSRWDDIVVSSPYFGSDQGQVSQIISERENNFFLKFQSIHSLYGENISSCLFGYSMTTISDINLDGIVELVISAPFCSSVDGSGALYIYLSVFGIGYINSIYDKISSTEFEKTYLSFGSKIMGLKQPNSKKFGLIVVTPFENKTYILEKNLLVFVTHTIYVPSNSVYTRYSCFDESLNMNVTCVKIAFCIALSYDPEANSGSDFDLSIKHQFKYICKGDTRSYIIGNKLSSVSIGSTNCDEISIGFKRSVIDFSSPINIVFSYEYYTMSPQNIYPMFVFLNETQLNLQFQYYKMCKVQNVCLPNLLMLPIDSIDKYMNYPFTHSTQYIDYSFEIRSANEAAYNPYLVIFISEEVDLRNVLVNNTSIEPYKETKFQNAKVLSFKIQFDLYNKDNVKIQASFKIRLSTNRSILIKFLAKCDYDDDMKNNILELEIRPLFNSSFSIKSWIEPNQTKTELKGPETTVNEHNIELARIFVSIRNLGPSLAKYVKFSLLFPYRMVFEEFLFISGVEITQSSFCKFSVTEFPPNLKNLPKNQSNGVDLTYGLMECQVDTIELNKSLEMSFIFILTTNVREIINKYGEIKLAFAAIFEKSNFTFLKIIKKAPEPITRYDLYPTPWWIIAIIIGLFFVILICIPLLRIIKEKFDRLLCKTTLRSYRQVLASAHV